LNLLVEARVLEFGNIKLAVLYMCRSIVMRHTTALRGSGIISFRPTLHRLLTFIFAAHPFPLTVPPLPLRAVDLCSNLVFIDQDLSRTFSGPWLQMRFVCKDLRKALVPFNRLLKLYLSISN